MTQLVPHADILSQSQPPSHLSAIFPGQRRLRRRRAIRDCVFQSLRIDCRGAERDRGGCRYCACDRRGAVPDKHFNVVCHGVVWRDEQIRDAAEIQHPGSFRVRVGVRVHFVHVRRRRREDRRLLLLPVLLPVRGVPGNEALAAVQFGHGRGAVPAVRRLRTTRNAPDVLRTVAGAHAERTGGAGCAAGGFEIIMYTVLLFEHRALLYTVFY